MPNKRIIVVGAGPGGLTAAMILAQRGFQVRVYEAAPRVGGRNAALRLGPYTFDTGPTFLMMDFVLRESFAAAGERLEDHLTLAPLDPMYRLLFDDRQVHMTSDPARMRAEIERHFPGNGAGYERFLKQERDRFERLMPCLGRDYSSLSRYVSPVLMRALPYLGAGRSVYQNLKRYFLDEKLILAFTFQAKYLGMSAWSCPALFTMIPYAEHSGGITHVLGGLHQISEAMARVVGKKGGELRLGQAVRRVLFDGNRATGVELANGERDHADALVLNADFAYAMTELVPPEKLNRYRPDRLAKKKFSCSTFMMYLGVNKRYETTHHTIVFARDYRRNVEEIFETQRLSGDDFSFYIQNASVTDPSLAPDGKSAIYILVPVPNQRSGIDWNEEAPRLRERVFRALEERTEFKDLRNHIEVERIITPADWEKSRVYAGATFNLAHSFSQLLYFRPHNEFEDFRNCYLVGGGTHPGSGLPVIYQSAHISSDMISARFGLQVKRQEAAAGV